MSGWMLILEALGLLFIQDRSKEHIFLHNIDIMAFLFFTVKKKIDSQTEGPFPPHPNTINPLTLLGLTNKPNMLQGGTNTLINP